MSNSIILTFLSAATGYNISWPLVILGVNILAGLGWCYYQIFLSPLAAIPGPLLCKIITTRYRLSFLQGILYRRTVVWHQKYGPIVRIGPNVVSIIDKTAIRQVHNSYEFVKARSWYHAFEQFAPGMFTASNEQVHRQLRRIFQPAFTPKALRGVEGVITEVGPSSLVEMWGEKLLAAREAKGGGQEKGVIVDLYHDLSFMLLDIITQLSLGKAVGVLKQGYHPIVEWIHAYTTLVAVFTTLPFLKHINIGFSTLRQRVKLLWEYSAQCIVEKRIRMDQEKREKISSEKDVEDSDSTPTYRNQTDMLSGLLRAKDPITQERLSDGQLTSETVTLMIAGTETTSATMCVLYNLLFHHPEVYQRLQEEVIQAFPIPSGASSGDPLPLTAEVVKMLDITHSNVKQRVPYVEAVLNETMRMYPAAPGILIRSVPRGGRIINGHYLPADTLVGLAITAYHYGPEWTNPYQFDPDRFVGTQGEKNLVKLLTFSLGPRQCVGRSLAYLEMIITLATIIRIFHVEPADDLQLCKKWVEFVTLRPQDTQFLCRIQPRKEFTLPNAAKC
ncbi:hypothetical protein IWQ62_002124 [Dispira parvispora]|uniref:Cytochrome P450 n=1 Tax=Dispira parvispora TaxID=1520584 RepID=A0A9W8E7T9_9FUNG|nr:hypothetical protein IWQ62_002124 [Dispira parvispora]